jgi:hypothetical protein
MTQAEQEVDGYLKLYGVLRLGFGIGAILAPKLTAASFGLKPEGKDGNVWAGLFGARAATVGLYSLTASKRGVQREAVLMNLGIETIEIFTVGREVRRRRELSTYTALASAFNVAGVLIWNRAQLLTR